MVIIKIILPTVSTRYDVRVGTGEPHIVQVTRVVIVIHGTSAEIPNAVSILLVRNTVENKER